MAGKGDKLTDAARTFVVQQLAMYDPPEAVVRAVKEEFGVVLTRQAVQAYDPTKYAGRQLSKKWRDLFEATRKAHLADTAEIGISHRAVRLRSLQRMVNKAEGQGNMALAAQLLKQAAEEVGGAYTNRRELSAPGGEPLVINIKRFSPDPAPDAGA